MQLQREGNRFYKRNGNKRIYLNGKKILITGSTGFIGKNLICLLRSKGYKIRALVRDMSKKEDILFLKNNRCELWYGDITEKHSLKNIDQGIDTIVHIAGTLGDFWKDDSIYEKVNVKGTHNLIDCITKNDTRFIFISSAGISGPTTDGKEDDPISPTNPYEQSKSSAEQYVKDNTNNHIILRPEFLFGEYDKHVLKLFQSIKKRRFTSIGDGTNILHPTYIRDLTKMIEKSIRIKEKNETFIIAGKDKISVGEFHKLIADKMGVSRLPFKINLGIARMYSRLFSKIFKKFNIDPIITDSRIDFFTNPRAYDTSKAVSILGLKSTSLEKGIARTIRWYEKRGEL